MTDKVLLEVNGPVAVITNNNPDKRNAFDDDMDARLFDILTELKGRPEVRAVIWRGEGKAWSSGRDVSVIGNNATSLSHHELMSRGHRGILQVFELDAPIIVAIHGWAIGGSFQRALLCDIRIAAAGSRFMLPEVGHGVIPDTGGMGRLYEICGSGVASDLVLTGRAMGAEEAYGHGIVSRHRGTRGTRRYGMGDCEQDRGLAEGHGQDGPPCPAASERTRGTVLHGGRADLPDLHQQVIRLRRIPSGERRRTRAALHGELTMTQATRTSRAATRRNAGPAGREPMPGTVSSSPVAERASARPSPPSLRGWGPTWSSPAGKHEHLGAGPGSDRRTRGACARGDVRHP